VIITTNGRPDVDRAILLLQIADCAHDAVTREHGDLRQAVHSLHRLHVALSSLHATCAAAGCRLTLIPYSDEPAEVTA
jgi:hypothetical protein